MKLLESLWAKAERGEYLPDIQQQTEVRCGVRAYQAARESGMVVEDGRGTIPVVEDDTLPELRLEISYENGTTRIVDLGEDA